MYSASEIRTVHLEMTSKCNASCPMCLRNVCGGVSNPQLPLTELTLADIQKIFTEKIVSQLNRIFLCGNYGDPVVAQDTLEALKYFRRVNNKIHLSIFTNGSARPAPWWKELADVTNEVHFAIDGLADTNHLYRRGTQFPTIIKNAQTYIQSGGRAVWDYIVFRHNEHQVEEARSLAKSMGFQKFNVKKTGRFFSNTRSEVKTQQEVLNVAGEVEYYLEMPVADNYQNKALQKEEELISKYGHIEKYLDQTQIDCKVSSEKSVYVSAQGFVFPCCWTANQLYPWYFSPRSSQLWKILDNLPQKEKSISALFSSMEEIVNGPFFKLIQDSWNLPSTQSGKLKCCAKTCGKEFDPFAAQFS